MKTSDEEALFLNMDADPGTWTRRLADQSFVREADRRAEAKKALQTADNPKEAVNILRRWKGTAPARGSGQKVGGDQRVPYPDRAVPRDLLVHDRYGGDAGYRSLQRDSFPGKAAAAACRGRLHLTKFYQYLRKGRPPGRFFHARKTEGPVFRL